MGPSQDWYFEIIINGVSHKIEGTVYNCDPNYYDDITPNYCTGYIDSSGIKGGINANSSDNSISSYVSGGSFAIGGIIDSIVAGMNNLRLLDNNLTSDIGVDCYTPAPGISPSNGLMMGFSLSPIDTSAGGVPSLFPINISSLSTPAQVHTSSTCSLEFGNSMMGSGSATIYILDTIDTSLPTNKTYRYRRPCQV